VRGFGIVTKRGFAGVAVGAALAVMLAACSPGADYPNLAARPDPRAQTMSPDQVKQARSIEHLGPGRPGQRCRLGHGGTAGYHRHHAKRWCRSQAVIELRCRNA